MQKLTIVMYHYVRPLKESRFPNIKGLDIQLFKEQLGFLKKHYSFVTMEQVIDAKYLNASLPKNPVLLTFDDAYLDHYLYVYPLLKKLRLQGSFFVPVKPIKENSILNVNKIHFILASVEDGLDDLLVDIKNNLEKYQSEYNLRSFDDYYRKFAIDNRFDDKNIVFIKRLLQVALPEKLRDIITSLLFKKYLRISDECFRNELYMNEEHCKHMLDDGMHLGCHGYNHYWWDKLNSSQLQDEISKGSEFLIDIGASKDCLTVAFPYGAYNQKAIDILKKFNYKLGFTTKVGVADLHSQDPLTLPRLDTNDIPKDANASIMMGMSLK